MTENQFAEHYSSWTWVQMWLWGWCLLVSEISESHFNCVVYRCHCELERL